MVVLLTKLLQVLGRLARCRLLPGASWRESRELSSLPPGISRSERGDASEKLGLVLSSANAGLWNWTAGDACPSWSPEILKLFGRDPADDSPPFDEWLQLCVHPEDRDRVEREFQIVLHGSETAINTEYRINHPKYGVRWVLTRGEARRGGGLDRVFGMSIDITGRKAVEDQSLRIEKTHELERGAPQEVSRVGGPFETALRESEDRFRRIYEQNPAGIAIADLNGQFQSCNPAFSAMLGYSQSELRKLHFQDLLHRAGGTNLSDICRLLDQEIRSIKRSSRCETKFGIPVWLPQNISLLPDSVGQPSSIIVLLTDMTEQKRNEKQIELLMAEVNHRSRNMLALLLAVVRQTIAATPDDFLDRFSQRIQALASSQDLLVANDWNGVEFDKLVRSLLTDFQGLIGSRIALRGPSLMMSPCTVQSLGIALHELAVNAARYGALSTAHGNLQIAWSLERGRIGEPVFAIDWRETGGPPVKRPARSGFGSVAVTRMIESSLAARVEWSFPVSGLTWRLECGAKAVLEGLSDFATEFVPPQFR